MSFDIRQAKNEIAARNALRRRYGLRALSIRQELRKMKVAAQEQDFERFIAENTALWERVSAHVLARMRRERRNPAFVPSGMLRNGGLEHGLRVDRILRWFWRRSRKA
jgi:hypothetical protein